MAQTTEFTIDGLKATVEGKEILKGMNLEIKGGEIHAIMGPNEQAKVHLLPLSWDIPNMK